MINVTKTYLPSFDGYTTQLKRAWDKGWITGKGCLIHAGTFISHDVTIGSFSEISPYVKLLGNVQIGINCSIGTSAVILPNIKIGNNVTVGAGAVVNKDIPDNTTVVDVPARPLKK